jgi:dGTPase
VRAEVIKEKDIPSHLIQVLGEWHASRIDRMVEDVVDASLKADLEKIAMSKEIKKAITDLRDFLYEKVYFNPRARPEIEKAEKIITDLYKYVLKNPEDYVKPYPKDDSLEKRAGDFIAGMTDRYALGLYEKIFFPCSLPSL